MRPVYWKRRDPGGFIATLTTPRWSFMGKLSTSGLMTEHFFVSRLGGEILMCYFDGWCMDDAVDGIICKYLLSFLRHELWYCVNFSFRIYWVPKLFMCLQNLVCQDVTAISASRLLSGTCWQSSHNIRLSTPRHAYLSRELGGEQTAILLIWRAVGCKIWLWNGGWVSMEV